MALRKNECQPVVPLWMITFSDMFILLLIFFVLMLSMTVIDREKFDKASKSLQKAFGSEHTAPETRRDLPAFPLLPKPELIPLVRHDTSQLYRKIKIDLKMADLLEHLELIKTTNGSITIRIKNSVLFNEGESILNPASYPLLRKLADIIRPLPLSIRIEGHSDSTGFVDRSKNNWDLSMARAVSVLRFYNTGKLLSLDRLSAIGYGDARPLVANTTPENKARNRRVDLLLINRKLPRPAGGGSGYLPF